MKKKATLPPLANQCGLVQAEQTKRERAADGWVGKQWSSTLSMLNRASPGENPIPCPPLDLPSLQTRDNRSKFTRWKFATLKYRGKKNKVGGLIHLAFKTYYRVTATKSIW